LDLIQEDIESFMRDKRKSPERITKNVGADAIYEREITLT
jgi:hypothetical protein